MVRSSIKAAYSLDPETVRLLERVARRWGVSKSEALRRAIRAAAGETAGEGEAVLDRLQEAAKLKRGSATTWARQVREERRKARAKSTRRN